MACISKQKREHRLTNSGYRTILDKDTRQTLGLRYTRLITRQGTPVNIRQSIKDSMTHSHEEHMAGSHDYNRTVTDMKQNQNVTGTQIK